MIIAQSTARSPRRRNQLSNVVKFPKLKTFKPDASAIVVARQVRGADAWEVVNHLTGETINRFEGVMYDRTAEQRAKFLARRANRRALILANPVPIKNNVVPIEPRRKMRDFQFACNEKQIDVVFSDAPVPVFYVKFTDGRKVMFIDTKRSQDEWLPLAEQQLLEVCDV